MSQLTNPERSRFPHHHLATRDFEAGGQPKSIGSTQAIRTGNQDCIISFPRKPHDQVEETRFDDCRGNWHWDIRTDTTVWSEQLYRMIGRENATIPPFKEHFRFYTLESWMRLVDATLQLLQTGTPYDLTLEMLHADCGRRWVIRSGEAVSDEGGAIVGLRGTVREISEGTALSLNPEGDWQTWAIAEDTAGRLIQTQEEEKAKLAAELREDVCQRVSLLAVGIDRLRGNVPDLPPQAETQLSSFRNETTEILVQLDGVSDRLRPVVVDLLTVPSALRCLCRKFTREHGISVEYSCSDVPANHLDKRCALILYRIVEEILVNVVRHSKATNVTVGLDHNASELRLRVSDNGVGFDQAKTKTASGLGFARMKTQIGLIGGSLAVWSKHASGTLIEARVPFTSPSGAVPSGH